MTDRELVAWLWEPAPPLDPLTSSTHRWKTLTGLSGLLDKRTEVVLGAALIELEAALRASYQAQGGFKSPVAFELIFLLREVR
jgi:hypothetical protein